MTVSPVMWTTRRGIATSSQGMDREAGGNNDLRLMREDLTYLAKSAPPRGAPRRAEPAHPNCRPACARAGRAQGRREAAAVAAFLGVR
jgi:hypothetical protein